MMRISKNLKADTVIAVAASIIALAALFVSTDQAVQSRKHNRLSVRPAFEFVKDISKDSDHPGLFLTNKGLGPGIVKEVQIKVGETWLLIQSAKDWRNVLKRLELNVEWIKWIAIESGSVIASNDNLSLLTIANGPIDESNKEKFRSLLINLKFRVRYESIYSESFISDTP